MSIIEKKLSEIDDKEVLRSFLLMAKEGLCSRGEILDKMDLVQKHLDDVDRMIADFHTSDGQMDAAWGTEDSQSTMSLEKEYDYQEAVESNHKDCKDERLYWEHTMTELEELLDNQKNFNKALCFANIRELLRQNSDVKIGQIEKEAGIRLGYMSRLEKDGNTSEPSIEFIVTASRLLKVSVDTLINVNLSGLTPTEHYIVTFFDKLKADTVADKLDWVRESEFNLNRIEADYNGFVWHPLFSEETFFEESECDYPNEVTRIVFSSKTFGPTTYIAGDCFKLRLKNGTTLYLMDIEKSVHRVNNPNAYAKEAWVHVPNKGGCYLIGTQDKTPIAPLLEELFTTIKDRMEHPQINNDVMYAIDAFMRDDLSDDLNDDIPF